MKTLKELRVDIHSNANYLKKELETLRNEEKLESLSAETKAE